MRITYLSNQRIPSRAANGVQTMRMCAAMAALGHELTLYCRPGTERDDPFAYYGLERRFRYRPLAPSRMRGLRTAAHVWQSRRAVRTAPPDLLYGRDLFALAANARRGIPLMIEAHRTLEGHPVELAVFEWLRAQPTFTKLITNSGGLRTWFLARFPSLRPAQVQVEPGAAVPLDDVTTAATLPGRPGALRVGYVGHLYRGRGVELLLELAERAADVDVFLVGGAEGDLAHWRARSTPANVHFLGHRPPSAVPRYLLAFDVLVAPYQRRVFVDGGAETSAVMSPLKLFEYLASGRPIVCSDLPVLREVLDDTVAKLVPPDDVGAWLGALDELRAPERRAELGAAGRARFLARHTWESRARRVLEHVPPPAT